MNILGLIKMIMKTKTIFTTITLLNVLMSFQIFSQNYLAGMGLTGLVNRNLNLSLERKVKEFGSAEIDIGLLIPGRIPHINSVIGSLTDELTEGYVETAFENMKFSAFSITPEIHYFPKKVAMKGLYFGPYARFANYMFTSDFNADVDYTDEYGDSQVAEGVVFNLKGSVQKIGVGVLVGYQWIFSEKYFIDWYIAGPGLLYASAHSNVVSPNFPSEREIDEFVENELEVIPEIFGDIEVTAVSDIEARGVWKRILPTCRFNVTLGFAF